MKMKINLRKIYEAKPCHEFWRKLLDGLELDPNMKEIPDLDVPILFILENNGWRDTAWCFRLIQGYDREIGIFSTWCVKRVEHLMRDDRSKNALAVAYRYAKGEASIDELNAARDDAADAHAAEAADRAASDLDVAAARAAFYAVYAVDADFYASADDAYAYAPRAASAASAFASRASRASEEEEEEKQIEEFKRMLDCIERGEQYDINM